MKKNIGNTDRIARLLCTALLGFLFFSSSVHGVWARVLPVSAAYALFTSFISYCPVYSIFNRDTVEKEEQTA